MAHLHQPRIRGVQHRREDRRSADPRNQPRPQIPRRNAAAERLTPPWSEFWKAACEFEINDDLEDDELDVDDGLLPQRFGLHAGETAERYYQQLIDAAACVGAVPDCGPICAAHPDPGQHRLDAHGTPGLNGLQRQLIRRATATAILAHAPNADQVPMGLHDWAEHTINAAVNWRQVLARALRHSLHTHTGASDYTWQRPARRQDPDDAVIRPRHGRPGSIHHRRARHFGLDGPTRARQSLR